MKHSWGDGTTYWKDEQMTDIVERLRRLDGNLEELERRCAAAADEIERLREFEVWSEDQRARLHGHIKRLENENERLIKEIKHLQELAYYANGTAEANIKRADEAEAENAKLKEALEHLRFTREKRDPAVAEIARAALQKDEGE